MTASPTRRAGRSGVCAAPAAFFCTVPNLSRHARPLNRYLRHEAGLGGRVRELAILTTARELGSQFEWAAHEPEALSVRLIIIPTPRRRGSDVAQISSPNVGRSRSAEKPKGAVSKRVVPVTGDRRFESLFLQRGV